MSDRICILADVRYVVTLDDVTLHVYKIEAHSGLPGDNWEPVHAEPYDGPGFELWRCNNCGRERKTWDEIRQHLGKFNQLIDPFNYEEIADG